MRGKAIGGALVGFLLGGVLITVNLLPKGHQPEILPQPSTGDHPQKDREGVTIAEMRKPALEVREVPAETVIPESAVSPFTGSSDEDGIRREFPNIEEESPELWEEYYKDLPVGFLMADRERVTSLIVDASGDEMRSRYERGLGEYIGDGQVVALDEAIDDAVITTLFFEPNGMGAYRVTLPRREFPDLYCLKDKEVWLLAEIGRRSQVK